MVDTAMDVGRFYVLTRDRTRLESIIKDSKKKLKKVYAELVQACTHPEAIQYKPNVRGWGPHRVCKVCGVKDSANKGATAGDEYNYGYAGHPDEDFWGDCDVEVTTDEKVWNSYSRSGWVVKDGKAVKGIW